MFAFSCYVLNQIEDGVPLFSKKNSALLKSRKIAECSHIPFMCPLAVFLDLEHAVLS